MQSDLRTAVREPLRRGAPDGGRTEGAHFAPVAVLSRSVPDDDGHRCGAARGSPAPCAAARRKALAGGRSARRRRGGGGGARRCRRVAAHDAGSRVGPGALGRPRVHGGLPRVPYDDDREAARWAVRRARGGGLAQRRRRGLLARAVVGVHSRRRAARRSGRAPRRLCAQLQRPVHARLRARRNGRRAAQGSRRRRRHRRHALRRQSARRVRACRAAPRRLGAHAEWVLPQDLRLVRAVH